MSEGDDSWLDSAVPILRENYEFCRSYKVGGETRNEIFELMNDAVDHTVWIAKLENLERIRFESATANYIFSMLFPLSQGICLDFLASNLLACYMQLRVLLEQLAKCLQADFKFPEEEFFQEKLSRVETLVDRKEFSLSGIIASLGQGSISLWGRLSNRWVHMKRFEPFVESIIERGVPGYALTIPSPYTSTDLEDVAELQVSTSKFREILNPNVDKWKTLIRRAEGITGRHRGGPVKSGEE